MPRGSHGGDGGGSSQDIPPPDYSVLMDQMLRKEAAYREGLKENHSLACSLAKRLQVGGELENLLSAEDLTGHRDNLKRLVEHNTEHEKYVSAFIAGLAVVKDQSQTVVPNYEEAIKAAMDSELEKIQSLSLPLHQQQTYREICNKLGEPAQDTTRASASANGDSGDGDEDLQVLPTVGDSVSQLKCPIMGTLMEDPVRNTFCGHVYSKQAILQHLKRDKRCPVFGCNNVQVTRQQLEDDRETVQSVRREKIRIEMRQKELSDQATAIDDDEEETAM